MLLRREQPGLVFLPEPVALAPDVEHVAVVQKPVQDRRGNDGVPRKLAPVGNAFVGSEDDAAPFVTGRHQGEEGGGGVPVVPNSLTIKTSGAR